MIRTLIFSVSLFAFTNTANAQICNPERDCGRQERLFSPQPTEAAEKEYKQFFDCFRKESEDCDALYAEKPNFLSDEAAERALRQGAENPLKSISIK